MERETGIEPATNSLEGCDSTTELLPPENSRQLSAVSPMQNLSGKSRSLSSTSFGMAKAMRFQIVSHQIPSESRAKQTFQTKWSR